MTPSRNLRSLLARLRDERERAGLTADELDGRLLIGSGWSERFEAGEVAPSVDLLVAMLNVLKVDPAAFLGSHHWDRSTTFTRAMLAEPVGSDLLVRFQYAAHEATYRLVGAKPKDFRDVLRELQQGLARLACDAEGQAATATLTDSVARAFLKAAKTWPQANPSDLWWFVIYRAYCDPFNHPACNAERDLGQSWKRTAGWALEEVLVRHYGPWLRREGIGIAVETGERKRSLLASVDVPVPLNPDKVDVLLTATARRKELCFGVVHVKASFAERRTDDVPLSRALIASGYSSPLWTMDCKSMPSANPVNRGELGRPRGADGNGRSEKRRDIEVHGEFSACFSYNRNTVPTPDGEAAVARVCVCDFTNPEDAFSRFVVSEWDRFRRGRG